MDEETDEHMKEFMALVNSTDDVLHIGRLRIYIRQWQMEIYEHESQCP